MYFDINCVKPVVKSGYVYLLVHATSLAHGLVLIKTLCGFKSVAFVVQPC